MRENLRLALSRAVSIVRGVTFAAALFLPAAILPAQDRSAADSAANAVPPGWWLRSAASFDPMPERWLLHAEADYTLSLQRGNIEGSSHQGRSGIYLRKGRATLTLGGGINRQSLSIARGVEKIEQEQFRISPTLDFDFTRRFGAEAGFLWERDDAAFIDNRKLGYVGLKVIPHSSERLVVTVLPAFGYIDEQAILTDEKRSFWAPYLEESITWHVSERLTLHQEGSFLARSDDFDTYRWRLLGAAEFPVTSYFSLMVNYETRFNNNPIPSNEEVMRLTDGQGSIEKQDVDLMVGFRLQY